MFEDKKVRMPKSIKVTTISDYSKPNKFDYYKIISMNEELEGYLTPTEIFNSFTELFKFINEHKEVILKNIELYCRKKVYLIEKKENCYKLTDYRKDINREITLNDENEITNFFYMEQFRLENCIMQKNIRCAQIGKTIYDLKIVMEKRSDSRWNMDSMECQIGGNNFIINYKSSGRYKSIISEGLKKTLPVGYSYQRIIDEIDDLCIYACSTIEQARKSLNRISINIKIDEDTRLWIIDINEYINLKAFELLDFNLDKGNKYVPLLYSAALPTL